MAVHFAAGSELPSFEVDAVCPCKFAIAAIDNDRHKSSFSFIVVKFNF